MLAFPCRIVRSPSCIPSRRVHFGGVVGLEGCLIYPEPEEPPLSEPLAPLYQQSLHLADQVSLEGLESLVDVVLDEDPSFLPWLPW